MAEITIGDLLTWEPRLSLYHDDQSGIEDHEVTWVVTVRASQPVLPPLRGGELVIVPGRTVEDTEVPLQELLREIVSRGATGIIFDHPIETPDGLVRLLADPIPVDLESDINRLLTERRGAIYRAGTDLGRMLQESNTLGADVEQVLDAAAAYLEMNAAVVNDKGEPIALSISSGGDLPHLLAAAKPRSWQGAWYGVRLAGAQTLWLGPVSDDQRALVRLVAERLAAAVETALAHAHDLRPRGGARSIALAGLFSATASDAGRSAVSLGIPVNGLFRVALSSDTSDRLSLRHDLAAYGAVHDTADFGGYATTLIEVRGRWRPHSAESAASSARSAHRPPTKPQHWIAISGPVTGAAHIPDAARQARFVAALLEQGAISGDMLHFDRVADIGVYQLLYPLWGSTALAAFATDALGHLPADDRRGMLRSTLLAYLETGGSQVEAAARLGVHRNTLSYRLKQIATSVGVDLADPAHHLALHMALLVANLPPAP